MGEPATRIRNRLRSVGRRVIAIRLQSRREADRPALMRSYRRLMGTTRAVMREAMTMVRRLAQRARTAPAASARRLRRVQQRLHALRPIVARVINQTRARVLGGDVHVADKVLSVFEPHTEAIRKGKHAKPTEFGKLVTIQESEHQIITAYQGHDRRPADKTLWVPALDQQIAIFGRPPDLATADRGFRRRPMRKRRPLVACGGGSSCRTLDGRRPRDAPMSGSAGFAAAPAGVSDPKAESVCSNDAMVCDAVVIEALTAPYAGSPRRHREQSGEHGDILEPASHRIEQLLK